MSIESTVVGAYPKPPAEGGQFTIRKTLHAIERGDATPDDLKKVQDEAVTEVIREQEAAGIDIVTRRARPVGRHPHALRPQDQRVRDRRATALVRQQRLLPQADLHRGDRLGRPRLCRCVQVRIVGRFPSRQGGHPGPGDVRPALDRRALLESRRVRPGDRPSPRSGGIRAGGRGGQAHPDRRAGVARCARGSRSRRRSLSTSSARS